MLELPKGQYFDKISISVKGIVTKHNSKSVWRKDLKLFAKRNLIKRKKFEEEKNFFQKTSDDSFCQL